MGLFSTRNHDGASGLAESANTISGKDWKSIRERAGKANPELTKVFSDEARQHREQAQANYRNRRWC